MKRWFGMFLVLLFCMWGGAVSAQMGTVDWSAEKQGIYQPLLTSNLEWSENVMKDGGFSLSSDKVVKEPEMADFVISQYGYIGARAIGKLQTFQQPIDKNTYRFPKDGFGYEIKSYSFDRGDVFLIETSDGKYVKIRIDEKSAERVKFTYVIETEKPAEEQFMSMAPKTTKNPRKEWKVTFSKPVAPSTINTSTVYVKEESGAIVPTKTRVSQDRLSVYIEPDAPYKADEAYTIFISKQVKSANDETLKTGISMVFTVTKTDEMELGWTSGLKLEQVSGNYQLSWNPNYEPRVVGYYVYQSVEGRGGFTKLRNLGSANEYFKTNRIELTMDPSIPSGTKVNYYITLAYNDGTESVGSNIYSYTVGNQGGGDPGPYKEFFGSWNLAVASGDFGTLTINPDGTYTRVDGPGKNFTGKWEVNRHGFVLLNADEGEDYIVEDYPERGGIKLLTLYPDGSYWFYLYGTK